MELNQAIHDLRAPLNAMVLNLELLRGRIEREPELPLTTKSDYYRYIEKVNQEIDRLKARLTALPGDLAT